MHQPVRTETGSWLPVSVSSGRGDGRNGVLARMTSGEQKRDRSKRR